MAVAPLDVIKINMQLHPQDASMSASARRIFNGGGLRAFWCGNLTAEYLWASYGAVQFVVYSEFKEAGRRLFPDPRWRPAEAVVCGAAAGFVATTVTYPLDLVRTRLARDAPSLSALQRSGGSSLRRVVRQVWGEAPMGRAFFRGLAPDLYQIVPCTAIHFGVYESLKSLLDSAFGDREQGAALRSSAAGATAGMAAKALTYPWDLVKRRMQVAAVQPGQPGGGSAGVVAGLAAILRADGARGLFRGLTPALAKSAVATGLTFCVHDAVSRFILRDEAADAAGEGDSTNPEA